jgi:hypothetical protein
MPQIDFVSLECTTVEGYTGGLSYAVPAWAPDIYAIGNSTQEPYNMCASTDGETSMVNPKIKRFMRLGPRSFGIGGLGAREVKGEVWTGRVHYIAVGDLVRT